MTQIAQASFKFEENGTGAVEVHKLGYPNTGKTFSAQWSADGHGTWSFSDESGDVVDQGSWLKIFRLGLG